MATKITFAVSDKTHTDAAGNIVRYHSPRFLSLAESDDAEHAAPILLYDTQARHRADRPGQDGYEYRTAHDGGVRTRVYSWIVGEESLGWMDDGTFAFAAWTASEQELFVRFNVAVAKGE